MKQKTKVLFLSLSFQCDVKFITMKTQLKLINLSHSLPVCLSVRPRSAQQQAFLLENVACNDVSCKDVGRTFHVHWDQSDLNAIPRAAVATFFDIYEDVSLFLSLSSRSSLANLHEPTVLA